MQKHRMMTSNGREVTLADIQSMGRVGGRADDRVLAELLRLTDRAILPAGREGAATFDGLATSALVQPSGADGKIAVLPFRAAVVAPPRELVGLTEADGTTFDALRSVFSGIACGATTAARLVELAPNAFGNPRWTLVYARVTPDSDVDPAPRFFKDISSGVVTSQALPTSRATLVELGVVDGDPAASPARPALPMDAGGSYYIPLAYLWIPSGFDASSTVSVGAIHECAPVAPLHSATGAIACAPANKQHEIGGTVDTRQAGASSSTRPSAYLPSTMVGGVERVVLLQLSRAPVSHADGDVVDDSIDWRGRFFTWNAFVKAGSGTGDAFASASDLAGGAPSPNAVNAEDGTNAAHGVGQSFVSEPGVLQPFAAAPADCNGVAVHLDDAKVSALGAGVVALYVRNTDGALVFKKAGAPGGQVFVWLRASAQFAARVS